MPAAAGDLALGIDAGGSSTRWLLLDEDGAERARGRLGPLSGLMFLGPDASDAVPDAVPDALPGAGPDTVPDADAPDAAGGRARVGELAAAVLAHGRPARVAAGVTGLSDDDPLAARVAGELARALGVPPAAVWVGTDVRLAFLAAFAPGAGVLVYAGTGAIGYHLRADNSVLRAGGHGFLLDDAGGGFWIGAAALRLLLRRADELGRPADGRLADAVYGALGAREWEAVRARVYGGGRAALAALVPAVASAADAGDPDALRVLRAAGAELGRLGRVLLARLDAAPGTLPVALAGGAAGAHPALAAAAREALPAGVRLQLSEVEPVTAAARLALAVLDEPGMK